MIDLSIESWKTCVMNMTELSNVAMHRVDAYGQSINAEYHLYNAIYYLAGGYNNQMLIFALCLTTLFTVYLLRGWWINKFVEEKYIKKVEFYYEAVLTGMCFTLLGIILALSKFGSFIVFRMFG